MKKILALTATMLLGIATVLWAAVPPPAANQTLGVRDTSFSRFVNTDCYSNPANCHATFDKTYSLYNEASALALEQKHHDRAALPVTDPKFKDCDFCHPFVIGPDGKLAPSHRVPCLDCHSGNSPHHAGTFAKDRDCQHCHGSFIDNYNDGHYIPTSAKSTVTPDPVGKIVVDKDDPTKTTLIGGCEACHATDLALTPPVYTNRQLHHGTGLGQTGSTVGSCEWCHYVTTNPDAPQSDIRQCETCHGEKSLHSIQADSPNAANLNQVSIYGEDLGYGHIGNNWDCWGCHGWVDKYGAPEASATVPELSALSVLSVNAGQNSSLTINGAGFISSDGSVVYKAVVQLAKGDTKVTLQPYSVTESEIKVTIPSTLAPGKYEVRVVKNDTVASNMKTLMVVTPVVITSAKISKTTVTILGSGFGAMPPQQYPELGVFINNVRCKVSSWSGNKIVVTSNLAKRGATLTVKTPFSSGSRKL